MSNNTKALVVVTFSATTIHEVCVASQNYIEVSVRLRISCKAFDICVEEMANRNKQTQAPSYTSDRKVSSIPKQVTVYHMSFIRPSKRFPPGASEVPSAHLRDVPARTIVCRAV